jgi:hypothetical protein|tara:strand:- start:222 stop:614 length:393 start_codon:yes stop_codon:yes gene_type:complete
MDITEITEIISGAFAIPEPPLTPLPPPLVALGGVNKTGLSARKIAARIISRQSEAGAPVGARRNGEDNVSEAMELIRIEEIVNGILTEMKIEVALRPGIPVTTTGIGNFGGPVVSQGATTNFATGNGQAR